MPTLKVVAGGQTGVDHAALEAARQLGLETGIPGDPRIASEGGGGGGGVMETRETRVLGVRFQVYGCTFSVCKGFQKYSGLQPKSLNGKGMWAHSCSGLRPCWTLEGKH